MAAARVVRRLNRKRQLRFSSPASRIDSPKGDEIPQYGEKCGLEFMIEDDIKITARDGFVLAATHVAPTSNGRDICVIVNSATAVRRQFYLRLAHFLAQRGITVILYDYRGIGGSRPQTLRGFNARMRDWGEQDMASVIDWAKRTLPNHRLVMLGHSAGGQLVALADNNHLVEGLATISAQSGYWRFYQGWEKPKLFFYWHTLLPLLTYILGYFPAKALGMGEDLPKGVLLQWGHWCRSPDYLFSDTSLGAAASAARLKAPILAGIVEDDPWAPEEAVKAFMSHYVNARIDYWRIVPGATDGQPIGHMGFFREGVGKPHWEALSNWIEGL